MSDTPRTDALLNNNEVVVDCSFLDFARQLERELAAKNTEKYCFSSCAFFANADLNKIINEPTQETQQ